MRDVERCLSLKKTKPIKLRPVIQLFGTGMTFYIPEIFIVLII